MGHIAKRGDLSCRIERYWMKEAQKLHFGVVIGMFDGMVVLKDG